MSDDFSELEKAARTQAAEEKATKAVKDTRARLVLSKDAKHVFFASLAFRLEPRPDWSAPTGWTDGRHLGYNPEWLLGLTDQQQQGFFIHEILHDALSHHTRRGHRDPKRWNVACDAAINPMVRDAGFQLPPGGVFPKAFGLAEGLAAEDYYALLPKGAGDGGGKGRGKGQPDAGEDPGGCGGVRDPGDGSEAARSESEAEWKVAVAQAADLARKRGTLSAGLERLVGAVLQPRVDWRDVLRDFVSKISRNDYAMVPPSRRFLHQGLYLPSLRSQELGEVVLAVDTSGSIGGPLLRRFAAEAQGILEAYDVRLTILYHDSEVCHVQRWQSSDGPLTLEPKGGGGTDHRPVFDWVEREALEPACLVALTDLASCFPPGEPPYPVVWCVPREYERCPHPWGARCDIDAPGGEA